MDIIISTTLYITLILLFSLNVSLIISIHKDTKENKALRKKISDSIDRMDKKID